MEFIAELDDYHDFYTIIEGLKNYKSLSYKELGMNRNIPRGYVAIFYDKKMPTQDKIDELLAQADINLETFNSEV